MTVRHIVMWDVRGDRGSATHRANMVLLKDAFEGLRGKIPGLLKIEVGLDFSAVDYACDVVLVSEFESAAALQSYQEHPAHQTAKRTVGDLRTTRHQVDYVAD
jgi:hypothetical protein